MSSIYFVDISSSPVSKARPYYSLRKKHFTYFQWRVFLLPLLLSCVGLSLIYLSFFFGTGALAKTGAATSYPPKLADIAPDIARQDTLSTDQVVSAKSEPTDLPVVNLASVDINSLHLAGTVQWPLRGNLTNYYSSYHQGIDIAARYGSNIVPFMEGVVIEVSHLGWGFGNYVVVQHKDGYKSLYGHLSTINVKVGDVVNLSTVIAQEGSSGYSTGPHLMLEVFHNNVSFNPLLALPR